MNKISTFLIIVLCMLGNLLGGYDSLILTLIIFMTIDYIMGITSAFFSKSLKSENGGLSSKVGFWGICKKCIVLVLVLVGFRLDTLLDAGFIRDSIAIGFIINETVSIIENAAIMGIPIPQVLKDAIDLLKNKKPANKSQAPK